SLDTLTIVDPLDGNTKTLTAQDSAKIQLNLFALGMSADSLVVSDSSYFNLYYTMTNIGSAALSVDTALVRIDLPTSPIIYRFPSGATDTTVYVILNQTGSLTLRSYDSTLAFELIRATLDTGNASFPRDVNNNLKSSVLNVMDTVNVQTRKVGNLTITELIPVDPAGALDNTVSSFQQFTLRAKVTGMSRLSSIKATISLPAEFATTDSLTKDIIPAVSDTNYVTWRIFANKDTSGVFNFNVAVGGIDTTTTTTKASSTALTMTLVRRADLSVDLFISAPVGATDDTLSASQQFVLSAIVTNSGQAQASGGQLTVTLPAGFTFNGSPATQNFSVGSQVDWNVIATNVPNFLSIIQSLDDQQRSSISSDKLLTKSWSNVRLIDIDSKQLSNSTVANQAVQALLVMAATADIYVDVTTLPIDENSSTAAHFSRVSDTVKTIVVSPADFNNLAVTFPGTRSDTISTDQVFTVKATFRQLRALTDRQASIVIPTNLGYTLADQETSVKIIADNDTTVQWSVVAPNDINGNQRNDLIRVFVSGADKNTGSAESDSLDRQIVIQTRAKLRLVADIVEPLSATDRFVSRGQTFVIRAKVINEGFARTSSTGVILFDGTSQDVTPLHIFNVGADGDTSFNGTTKDTVRWFVTAPDTVISQPLRIQFRTDSLPRDINSGLPAFLINEFSTITVSTEKKTLKVTRIVTAVDTTKKAAQPGERIDSMLVLKLENIGSTEGNSSEILTQRFWFVVEQYDVRNQRYEKQNWNTFLDSLYVMPYGQSSVMGRILSSSPSDTVIVQIDDQIFRSSITKSNAIDLEYGLATKVGSPDIVSFTAVLAPNGQITTSKNFRIRLVDIDAFDYDSIGSARGFSNSASFNPLDVVNERGNPLGTDTTTYVTPPVRVIDPNGATNQRFANYPNPFGSSERPRTTFVFVPRQNDANTVIEIYTLAGNLVKKVRGNNVIAGQINETFVWDGTNDNGQFVRNGVYIAIIKSQGLSKSMIKVVVAR
ncbi:hypothetical protein K1X84_09850, partial [bacterium]|nr:hypothetical protein [bacterium]